MLFISPDQPDKLAETTAKSGYDYTLLSDSKTDAAQAFGVAFHVDDETVARLKDRFKMDIEADSGETHHILPVPAVFISLAHWAPRYYRRSTHVSGRERT